MIPTHWGLSGQPDAFSEKTYFSSIAYAAHVAGVARDVSHDE